MKLETKQGILFAVLLLVVIIATYFTGGVVKHLMFGSGATFISFKDIIDCYAFPFFIYGLFAFYAFLIVGQRL